MLNYSWLIILIVLLFAACSKNTKYAAIVNVSDKIQLSGMETGQNIADSSESLRGIFKKVFEYEPEDCNCEKQGELSFFKNGNIILSTVYSEDKDCVFLIVNDEGRRKCFPLTYQAGMYISETLYNLKKSNDKNKYR